MEQQDQLLLDRQLSFLLSQSGGLPLPLKEIEAQSNLLKDRKLKNSKSSKSSVKRREFRCNFCNKAKRCLPELLLHERIHTGEKPYSCSLCLRGFAWKQCWENHEKICHRVHRKKKKASTKTKEDTPDPVEGPTSKEPEAPVIKTDENEVSQVKQEVNEDVKDVSVPDLKDTENNVAGPSAQIDWVKLESVVRNEVIEEDLQENQNQNPSLIKRYKCNSCPQRFVSILTCQNHRLSHNGNSSSSIPQFNELKTENTSATASKPESAVQQAEAPKRKKKYRKGGNGFMRNMTIIKRKTPSSVAAASANYRSRRIRKRLRAEKKIQKQKQEASSSSTVTSVKIKTTTTTFKTTTGQEKLSFDCDICGKRFQSSVSLTNHLRSHKAKKIPGQTPPLKDLKKFTCSYCSRQFAQKTNLRTHERIHTGEAPYACKVCNQRFKASSGLGYHVRKSKCCGNQNR